MGGGGWGWVGWQGKIKIKDHLSPVEADIGTELGKKEEQAVAELGQAQPQLGQLQIAKFVRLYLNM